MSATDNFYPFKAAWPRKKQQRAVSRHIRFDVQDSQRQLATCLPTQTKATATYPPNHITKARLLCTLPANTTVGPTSGSRLLSTFNVPMLVVGQICSHKYGAR